MLGKASAAADELEASPPATVGAATRSPSRSTCCAGSPTSTSRSSATASTRSATTAPRSTRCPARASASCAPTGRRRRANVALSPEVRALAREPRVLVLTKANSRSTVHRASYLDYVGVKTFDADGNVVGERRFLGLYTSTAYTQSVITIPVLRRTADQVLDRSGLPRRRALLQGPAAGARDLPARRAVPGRRPTSSPRPPWPCCTCRSGARRGCSCAATATAASSPAWSTCRATATRPRCACAWPTCCARSSAPTSSTTPRACRSRCSRACTSSCAAAPTSCCRSSAHDPLEARLTEATRSWDDEFADALVDQCGEEVSARLAQEVRRRRSPRPTRRTSPHAPASSTYASSSPSSEDGGVALNLYEPHAAAAGERRFKIYRRGGAISLSTVLPVLQRMGVEVVDERPYEIEAVGSLDVGLRLRPAARLGPGLRARHRSSTRFQEAFLAAWSGAAEADGFNALVVAAGLTWRQAMVLRAYARYLRQAGTAFSQAYLESSLVANVPHRAAARPAVRGALRPCRPPATAASRRSSCARRSTTALESVASLDHDRILRSFLALDRRHAAHQLLPGRSRRRAQGLRQLQARPRAGARPARAPPALRDLGLQPACRGRPPALRCGGARRAALVGPSGGLPHGGARAGEGADGEERRHRAGRRQGRLRRQGLARPVRRPRGVARRGHRLLPHVHLRAARRHRQPRGRRGRAAARRRAPRRRRHLSRRGGRQGHRHLQRHRQRRRDRPTASGSATRSPRAARRATTTRPWASPPAARGSR